MSKVWYFTQGEKISTSYTIETKDNDGKSAASFCQQVAALVLDVFCNFYLLKNHKIPTNSAATEATENKHIFGILRIL